MNMRMSALTCCLSFALIAGSVQAELRSNWRDIYTPTFGWEAACGYKLDDGQSIQNCRTKGMVYFHIAGDAPGSGDIILHMLYDHRRLWLSLAPYEGECVSGRITSPNGLDFKLRKANTVCVPENGIVFAREGTSGRPNHIDVETLKSAPYLSITLTRDDGTVETHQVYMEGFDKALATIESSGGRGR